MSCGQMPEVHEKLWKHEKIASAVHPLHPKHHWHQTKYIWAKKSQGLHIRFVKWTSWLQHVPLSNSQPKKQISPTQGRDSSCNDSFAWFTNDHWKPLPLASPQPHQNHMRISQSSESLVPWLVMRFWSLQKTSPSQVIPLKRKMN